MIQRDYAQGRPSEVEVRDEFLNALESALRKPATDSTLPLNLDFVYGSVEGEGDASFLPLDGQQRLTTLFLLHWHLAWVDNRWDEFTAMFLTAGGLSRFTYRVRPSSNEFFDALVSFRPIGRPSEVASLSDLVTDQPWYFRNWRLDPTIQSVLGMLDAIHRRFSAPAALFDRLMDTQTPAVTFQLLDLNNFGLSDDLYIKMNARGKPLTPFETFKARYEQELKTLLVGVPFFVGQQRFSVADYVSLRLDTAWADLFWALRDAKSDSYDAALMNVFRAIALVSRDLEASTYSSDFDALRASRRPTYADFHTGQWLDSRFTLTLIRLLDAWKAQNGRLSPLLPSTRFFDEKAIFEKIAQGSNLSYSEIVQFAAYAAYIREYHAGLDTKAFEKWMRVVHNLSINTSYNRLDDLRRSLAGIESMIGQAAQIEVYLADPVNPVIGFNEQQIAEERLKAQLLLANAEWQSLLDRAEGHGYFRGQVEFLLDFSGVSVAVSANAAATWTLDAHARQQEAFELQLRHAERMFSATGLQALPGFRWQRALLSQGDYFLQHGRNRSFLPNPVTEDVSWKRFLRGGLPGNPKRNMLRQLWSQLSLDDAVAPQLDRVIESATGLESWREAMVRCPAAFSFCERHSVRFENETVFLLKRSQLNGAHAELFAYCLYSQVDSAPTRFPALSFAYYTVSDTYSDPYIEIKGEVGGRPVLWKLRHQSDKFVLSAERAELNPVAGLLDRLVELGFEAGDEKVMRHVARDEVGSLLAELDAALSGAIPA
jgi:hypothetical protein